MFQEQKKVSRRGRNNKTVLVFYPRGQVASSTAVCICNQQANKVHLPKPWKQNTDPPRK